MKLSAQFIVGRYLCILGSLFPITVGSYFYAKTTNDFLYSLNIELSMSQLISKAVSHVAFTNLTMTGITLFLVSVFGLNSKSKLSWWHYFLATIWVGGNDSFALTAAYLRANGIFPVAFFPLIFGLIGCALTSKEIFVNQA